MIRSMRIAAMLTVAMVLWSVGCKENGWQEGEQKPPAVTVASGEPAPKMTEPASPALPASGAEAPKVAEPAPAPGPAKAPEQVKAAEPIKAPEQPKTPEPAKPPEGETAFKPDAERVYKLDWNILGATDHDIEINGFTILAKPPDAKGSIYADSFLKPGANTIRIRAAIPAKTENGRIELKLVSSDLNETPGSMKELVKVDEKALAEGLTYDKTVTFEATGMPPSVWHKAESIQALSAEDRQAIAACIEAMRDALARKDAAVFLRLRLNRQDMEYRAKVYGTTYEEFIKNGAADMQKRLMAQSGYEVKAAKPEELAIEPRGQLTVVAGKPYILWAGAAKPAPAAAARTVNLTILYFCKVDGKWVVFQ